MFQATPTAIKTGLSMMIYAKFFAKNNTLDTSALRIVRFLIGTAVVQNKFYQLTKVPRQT